jgi:hypothetical protein
MTQSGHWAHSWTVLTPGPVRPGYRKLQYRRASWHVAECLPGSNRSAAPGQCNISSLLWPYRPGDANILAQSRHRAHRDGCPPGVKRLHRPYHSAPLYKNSVSGQRLTVGLVKCPSSKSFPINLRYSQRNDASAIGMRAHRYPQTEFLGGDKCRHDIRFKIAYVVWPF